MMAAVVIMECSTSEKLGNKESESPYCLVHDAVEHRVED